jgi:hypothetical protein
LKLQVQYLIKPTFYEKERKNFWENKIFFLRHLFGRNMLNWITQLRKYVRRIKIKIKGQNLKTFSLF